MLSGLFDAELLAELTEENHFVRPMKKTIVSKDISSFNKMIAYMVQFWTKMAVVVDCVIVDKKLTIPHQLRSAMLARLQRLHPGKETRM